MVLSPPSQMIPRRSKTSTTSSTYYVPRSGHLSPVRPCYSVGFFGAEASQSSRFVHYLHRRGREGISGPTVFWMVTTVYPSRLLIYLSSPFEPAGLSSSGVKSEDICDMMLPLHRLSCQSSFISEYFPGTKRHHTYSSSAGPNRTPYKENKEYK